MQRNWQINKAADDSRYLLDSNGKKGKWGAYPVVGFGYDHQAIKDKLLKLNEILKTRSNEYAFGNELLDCLFHNSSRTSNKIHKTRNWQRLAVFYANSAYENLIIMARSI